MSAINDFSLNATNFSSLVNKQDMAIVNEHFGMLLNVGPYLDNFIHIGQPYRFAEGRILLVTSGIADCEMTLESQHFAKGDIILVAPETIMELKSCSSDFNMIGIICKECITQIKNICLRAQEKDWNETMELARCLWNLARHKPFRRDAVNMLVSTIIHNVSSISISEQETRNTGKTSRQEQQFQRFRKLVNEHCSTERSVSFYADKLAVTPHYLSSLISSVSGKNVMYWIRKAVIIQAKIMLKEKGLFVYEVADRLNFPNQSAFGRFFRQETGMSPGEYQRSE